MSEITHHGRPRGAELRNVYRTETRRRWVEAAANLLASRGPDALRVTRLCAALKSNRNSFYYHFEDRNDLIRQLANYWHECLIEEPMRNFALSTSLEDGVFCLLEDRLFQSRFQKDFDLGFRELASNHPMLSASIAEADMDVERTVQAFMQTNGYGYQEGYLRGQIILSMKYGPILNHLLDMESSLEHSCGLVFYAITGRSPEPRSLQDAIHRMRRRATEMLWSDFGSH